VTDEVDTGSGIPKRFRDLSADVREERLVRYVVKQLGLDRHMDDIMKDEEVVAHSSEVTRTDLMQNPAVLRALEEQIKRQFSGYSAVTGPDADDSASG
jgi:septation ring formation regulator EzrA